MKKLLVLALALLMLASAFTTSVSALTANGSWGNVPLYKGEITVDGKMDNAYNYGLALDCSADFKAAYATDTTAKLWLLHDGSCLYVFINVKSANALTDYNHKYDGSNHWNTTGAEVMVDWSNDAKGDADVHKYMGWYDDTVVGHFIAAGKEKETISAYKTTVDKAAKTWTAEFKLNFMEGAKTGSEIGFNCMIDSDANMGPTNEAKRQICSMEPEISNAGQKYKNVTLSSTVAAVPVATAAATTAKAAATTAKAAAATTTKAAQTSDVLVYVMSAVAMSGASLAVLKSKKHK